MNEKQYKKIIKILYYILIKKKQRDINVKETGAVTEKLYIEYADSFNEWGILQIQ